jgi:hypothetical protein
MTTILDKHQLYKAPSGLGGFFTVKIIAELGDRVHVRVTDMGDDWNGFEFTPLKSVLAPVSKARGQQ